MSDEDLTLEDGDLVDAESSNAEVYGWSAPSGKGGMYVFPVGVEAWAAENGVALVHIDSTTGVITVQHEIGQPFRDITKTDRASSVASIGKK